MDYTYNIFDIGNDINALNYADSAALLHEYQKKAVIGKNPDYNYEYDRFPKNFVFSKNFQGMPSNPRASGLDKLHTESFITNKVRHIEDVYVGSNEMPEELERQILPQPSYKDVTVPHKCNCPNCRNKVNHDYLQRNNVNMAIEELQKRNEILTLLLIFVVIYCLVQLFYPARGYSAITETTAIVGTPSTTESTPKPEQ
jgi:hypothetical protein